MQWQGLHETAELDGADEPRRAVTEVQSARMMGRIKKSKQDGGQLEVHVVFWDD